MEFLKSHTIYNTKGCFAKLFEKRQGFAFLLSVRPTQRQAGRALLIHKQESAGGINLSVHNKIHVAVEIQLRLLNYAFFKRWKQLGFFETTDTRLSEYAWYLHQSKLNRIYDLYAYISKLLKEGQSSLVSRSFAGDTIVNRGAAAGVPRAPVYNSRPYGDVNIVFQDARSYRGDSYTATESHSSENRIQFRQTGENLGNNGAAEVQTMIRNSVNMRHIADMVGKELEGKLRLERLKKGY